jgi:hypothetical protein
MIIELWMHRRDLRELSTSRNVEALNAIFNIIADPKAVEDRHHVYNELPAKSPLTRSHFEIADRVLRQLDYVGLLIRFRLVNEDIIMELYYKMFIRCSMKLKHHIEYQRKKRGNEYRKHFEWLCNRSEIYHKTHYPKEPIDFPKELFKGEGALLV